MLEIDDLGMMIHADHARHIAFRIAREFEHGHRRAVLALECEAFCTARIVENEIEEAVVDDPIVPVIGKLVGKTRKPGMLRRCFCQYVSRNPAAFHIA